MSAPIAGYHCPCGTRYTLSEGASDAERVEFDTECADHESYCSMAQAGMAETPPAPKPTIATTIALAADLVQDAAVAGIEVRTVNLYCGDHFTSVMLSAADEALTQPLTVVVAAHGAPVEPRYVDHEIWPWRPDRYIDAYVVDIDGVEVTVQGTLPASIVEAERAAVAS